MPHRFLEWCKVVENHQLARDRLSKAQELYEEALKELKPGELSPGISEVMIRKSERQKYRKALIVTPSRLNLEAIFFTNGKSSRVEKFEMSENPGEPFLWITLESKPAKKKRELKERWRRAGIEC